MSTAAVVPSTPTSQTAPPTAPETPQTGTWRHPRFDEITRRQNASTFSDQNAQKLVYNAAILVLTYASPAIGRVLYTYIPLSPTRLLTPLSPYPAYALLALRLLLVLNVLLALLPLLRPKDDLADIPLTPSQRALLGLDPSTPSASAAAANGATPGSQYVTPPRYPRSATPRRSGSVGGSGSSRDWVGERGNGSPLGLTHSASHSPFSPPSASPLLQKAVGGHATRRLSYGGAASPLGLGGLGDSLSRSGSGSRRNSGIGLGDSVTGRDREGSALGTPTPGAAQQQGKGPSVGLNSRWLYERGRGSPGGRGLYL